MDGAKYLFKIEGTTACKELNYFLQTQSYKCTPCKTKHIQVKFRTSWMDFNQVLEKRKIRIHSLEAPKIGL